MRSNYLSLPPQPLCQRWHLSADLLKSVLLNSERPAIATHDLEMIELAKRYINEQNIRHAESQFFAGVRDDLAIELVREGYKCPHLYSLRQRMEISLG